jgi:hypothetical protein
MPTTLNPRQERFCQLVKQGVPRYRAYPLAGYQFDGKAPYRLSENVRVKARMAELDRMFQVKTRVTLETICEKLDEDRAFAQACGQAAPALNATIAKGKLHGLFVDRQERGDPGAFDKLQSAEEVLALVRAELGDEVAELLIAALAR